jgi:acetyl-CoA carboxylase beta subunit
MQQSFHSLMQILKVAVFLATVGVIYFSYITMLNNNVSIELYTEHTSETYY